MVLDYPVALPVAVVAIVVSLLITEACLIAWHHWLYRCQCGITGDYTRTTFRGYCCAWWLVIYSRGIVSNHGKCRHPYIHRS